jgi:hypothetical protein
VGTIPQHQGRDQDAETALHAPLCRVRYQDPKEGKQITLLSNHFHMPALTITELHRSRWQVELFFKSIKQHLRINAFFGPSSNAVKTQIWTAVSVYVLVAILKKRLGIDHSLYTLLQMLRPLRERTTLPQSTAIPTS